MLFPILMWRQKDGVKMKRPEGSAKELKKNC